jgi:hypothetical protein
MMRSSVCNQVAKGHSRGTEPKPMSLILQWFRTGSLGVAKDEVLRHQTPTAAKEAKHDSEGESEEVEHGRL